MKIALAQINLHVGNFTHNIERTTRAIHEARKQDADLVVFPEMTVCGYPAKDLLLSESFVIQCRKAIDTIASECNGIAAIVGAPAVNTDSRGKPLYNAAYLLEE
ncbi:MAG: nitrilase-related carbon-nitrogen hydrolase, partial [Bacteroidota bacterium]